MKEIVFIGLGLDNEKGITLRGLEELKTADFAFAETYTSVLSDSLLKNLEKMSGTTVNVVTRNDIENRNGKIMFEAAQKGKVAFLVPGDPLIATTHIALRIEAEKLGIRTRVVHGSSILSAAIGLSGLHNYKFGKSVTIPFPDPKPSRTPYEVINQNKRLGLHTLCLLDLKAEEKRSMTISEALSILMTLEKNEGKRLLTGRTLAVGIARAGSSNASVRAGFVSKIAKTEFGEPPHSLIFPGELHFMEAEALIFLAGAPDELRSMVK